MSLSPPSCTPGTRSPPWRGRRTDHSQSHRIQTLLGYYLDQNAGEEGPDFRSAGLEALAQAVVGVGRLLVEVEQHGNQLSVAEVERHEKRAEPRLRLSDRLSSRLSSRPLL